MLSIFPHFLSSPSLFAGSFFIPLFLIVFLYCKIFLTQKKVASRRQQIKTRPGGGGGATSASGTATREQHKQVNAGRINIIFCCCKIFRIAFVRKHFYIKGCQNKFYESYHLSRMYVLFLYSLYSWLRVFGRVF